ncbi:hypothetical protein ACQP2E_12040 [Actinoplanes sp. CA-015351]|uniref:hypothetical protein n=1 Tax=Actinoplanes sp. CA-015351 TaxID=3239897 RepID=UPI003D99BB80
MSWAAGVSVHRADRVNHLALHPLGSTLLIADAHGWRLVDDEATLWTRTEAIHRAAPSAMLWTPAGDVLFAAVGGRILALRADTGGDLTDTPALGAVADATALAIDASGQDLAVGTRRGAVHLVNLKSRGTRELSAIDPVVALAWNGPSSLLVATGDTVQQWDTDRRTMVRTPAIALDGVTGLRHGTRSSRTALIDRHGVRLLGTRGPTSDLIAEVPAAVALAFSRDESRLLLGTPANVYVLDTALVQQAELPGEVLTGGHLSRAECGLVAVRRDETSVAVYRPPDARRRLDRETDTFAVRRWAASMALTVGRARSVAYDERPLATEAEPIPQAGEGSGSPGFVWTLDGWIAESPAGRLIRARAGAAHPEWDRYIDEPIAEITADPRVRHVAIAARNQRGRVRVLDAGTGEDAGEFPGGQSPVLAPDDRDLLAVPEAGAAPRAVLIYEITDPSPVARLPVDEGVGRIAWSPDGAWLAGAADGKVIIWNTRTWQRERLIRMPGTDVLTTRVSWSPDGEFLAAQTSAGRGGTQIFLTSSGDLYHTLAPAGGRDWAPALAWSPDAKLLAGASGDRLSGEVEIWGVADGRTRCRIPPPDAEARDVWTVTWSPAGDQLAVTYTGGRTIRYRLSRPAADADSAALHHPAPLLARLGGFGQGQPLTLLVQLLDLLGEDNPAPALDAVADLRGVRALRALRWPVDARIGLVTMIAADLETATRYRAPAGALLEDMTRQLLDVLLGVTVEPDSPAPPISDLARVLGDIDERTMTLLRLLGPRAVADDPTLPVRMRGLRAHLAPLGARELRLLSVRLDVSGHGRAEGGGTGEERAGLARHGRFNRLLPTLLALDQDVFEMQYAEGNLLYRTRSGRLPPEPRSAVIVLDDTPAAHGQVGITLRTCAHLLAGSMIEYRRRCLLVPLGEPSAMTALDEPADLLRIWTARSVRPPRTAEAAQTVTSLLSGLTDGMGTPPLVVLLTHPFQAPLRVPHLQTITVAYPRGGTRALARRSGRHLISTTPSAATLRWVLTRVLRAA